MWLLNANLNCICTQNHWEWQTFSHSALVGWVVLFIRCGHLIGGAVQCVPLFNGCNQSMAAIVQWVRHSLGAASQLPQFNGGSSMTAVQWRRFKNSGSMANIQRQRFCLQFNGNKSIVIIQWDSMSRYMNSMLVVV